MSIATVTTTPMLAKVTVASQIAPSRGTGDAQALKAIAAVSRTPLLSATPRFARTVFHSVA